MQLPFMQKKTTTRTGREVFVTKRQLKIPGRFRVKFLFLGLIFAKVSLFR